VQQHTAPRRAFLLPVLVENVRDGLEQGFLEKNRGPINPGF
jgi:hypothetical protein